MTELPTFHIQYPTSSTFLTWDELGCLSRSLGFPSDLFLRYYSQDVGSLPDDNQGIFRKTFEKMLHQVSFQSVLHRTYNMHTSQWNIKVIEHSLIMLEHKILDFDDLYKVRIAYMTYEHGDMKGMLLNKNILMRTLKFCDRVISPLKLMHRVKHMKEKLEERGRIQLYEFFGLILWCDVYTSYNPSDAEHTSGKVGDLFKIVDFYSLLTHHDERLVSKLNDQYLKEERSFGTFLLGSRSRPRFADLVVYTEPRISLVNFHNEKYRFLKQEITESEIRVSQAQAGSIRNRPISAPDLCRYKEPNGEPGDKNTSSEIGRNTLSNRLQSAPARVKSKYHVSTPDTETPRTLLPSAVTADDIAEIKAKMAALNFDRTTLGSRTQLNLEAEIDYYIPGYLDRRPTSETVTCTKPIPVKKPGHWTVEIIQRLTKPGSLKGQYHFRCCSASEALKKVLLNKTISKSKSPTNKGHVKTARVRIENKGQGIRPSSRSTEALDSNIEDKVESCNTEGVNFELCDLPTKHNPGCNGLLEQKQNNKSLIALDVYDKETGEGNDVNTWRASGGNNVSCSLQDETKEVSLLHDVIGNCSSLSPIGSSQNEAETINNVGNKQVTWGPNNILVQLTDQVDTPRNTIEPVTTIKDSHGIYRQLEPVQPDKPPKEKKTDPTRIEFNKELDTRLGLSSLNWFVPDDKAHKSKCVSAVCSKTLSVNHDAGENRQGQIKGGDSTSVVPRYYKLRADRDIQLSSGEDIQQLTLEQNLRVKEKEFSRSDKNTVFSINPVFNEQIYASVSNKDKDVTIKTRRIAQTRLLKQLHRSRV